MSKKQLTVDDVIAQFDEFAELVRQMRALQSVPRFRESITQSGARAKLETEVDAFLSLLQALPLRVQPTGPDER